MRENYTQKLEKENAKLSEKLEEQETRLQILYNSENFAAFTFPISQNGIPGKFTEVNDIACQRLGFSRKELLNLTPIDIVEKSYVAVFPRILNSLLQNRQVLVELVYVTKKGDKYLVEVNAHQFDFRNQSTILWIAHDVTDRKKADEDIKHLENYSNEVVEAKRIAEVASRAKSEFLANISHELRTPLNAIIGFSEVLSDGQVGAITLEQRELLSDIREMGRHVLNIINAMLDVSKIESGQMGLTLEKFPLADFLITSAEMFEDKISKQNLSLQFNLSSVASEEMIADKGKIRQILFNLLSNAIKFTPAGGALGIDAVKNSNGFSITVWDSGIGIAKENLARLFHPFEQVEDPFSKNFEGTGLGLYYSKKLVELHQGTIQVASELGRGSRFTIMIPLKALS